MLMGRMRFTVFRIVILILAVFLMPVWGRAEEPPVGRVRVVIFYSEKAGQSLGMTEGILPAIKELHALDLHLYDVDIPQNFSLLSALEETYGLAESELPVVFIGKDVIAGEENILEGLELAIAKYESMGGTVLPALPEVGREETALLKHPVYVAYFNQTGCPACARSGSLLDYVKTRYSGLIVKEIDIDSPDGKLLNESLCERLKVPDKSRLTAPALFFSEDFLIGQDIVRGSVERLIQTCAERGGPPPWELDQGELVEAETRILERFKGIRGTAVAVAGLIAGLNPCAFATLIFFISYLTMLGRERREILLVGLSFSLSVFVTCFVVGLGLLGVVEAVVAIPSVSRAVYVIALLLAAALGVLSLYDYVLCRRGRTSAMVLQMPGFLKERVRGVIRKEVKVSRYVLAAVATGFVVSLLELSCTGQVYLPTILFVSRFSELRLNAMGYLALYNFMFIVPLLAVFGLVCFGTGSERLSSWFQNHVATVKLATSLLFFGLAGVLLLGLV